MKEIFDSDSTSKPIEREQRSGIESSVLWINIGPNTLLFILYIVLIPFVLIGTKIPYISDRCYVFLENYKFSFFIRFWIQVYLDFGIFSLIQIHSVIFTKRINNLNQAYLNFITAFILIVRPTQTFISMTPLSFILLLYRYRNTFENYKVKGKYGSLFLEFKNNRGFISYLFYPVFLIRRIQYMLNQVFYDYNPKGQLALNIVFSFFNFCY